MGGTGQKPDQAKDLRRKAGHWLKKKRQAAALTQKDLAGKLNLDYYTFISQIESGHARVPSSLFPSWAEAVGVDGPAFARKMIEFYDPHAYLALGFEPTESVPSILNEPEGAQT